MVGVDQGPDRPVGHGGDRLEVGPGAPLGRTGVDADHALAGHQEAGVVDEPAAVGLDVGEDTVADLLRPARELEPVNRCEAAHSAQCGAGNDRLGTRGPFRRKLAARPPAGRTTRTRANPAAGPAPDLRQRSSNRPPRRRRGGWSGSSTWWGTAPTPGAGYGETGTEAIGSDTSWPSASWPSRYPNLRSINRRDRSPSASKAAHPGIEELHERFDRTPNRPTAPPPAPAPPKAATHPAATPPPKARPDRLPYETRWPRFAF